MDIESALKKLFSLHQFGIKLGLNSTLQLLDKIGNPHQELKCIHVAGTNGKGSTCSFIASILMEMGFNVGLYTSPHFIRFNERIRINGKEIDDAYIADFTSNLEVYINENSPTFFELTTALAFKYFFEQKIDYVVLETGLGGRLDSTNVVNPLISVITSISLDHTAILGETIEKIAFEKGGIIKNFTPVIVGRLPKKAELIIKQIAEERNSKFHGVEDYLELHHDFISVKTKTGQFQLYQTPLIGYHQLLNAALAIKSISEVIEVPDPILVSRGIQNVITNSGIQGRYEILSKTPKVIMDSAHNPEGVKSFIEEFVKEEISYRNRYLIFGAMSDKDYREMLKILSPHFDRIFLTHVEIDRAAGTEELSNALKEFGAKGETLPDPAGFIQQFLLGAEDNCLVILGSMYLLGEIKMKIFEKRLDIKGGTD